MKVLKLAIRNVLRNKRRSLISVSVLMIGIMGLGIFGGFMHFSFWGIQENIVHVGMGTPEGTGHLQIFNSNYFKKEESRYLQYGISDWKELIRKIEALPEVDFATPRIDLMGLISNGDQAEPIIGFAIDPVKEERLPGMFGSAEPYVALENAEDGVILGQTLAKKMNATEGEYLTLLSSTVDGAINAIDLRYIGSINTGTPEGDKRFVLVHLQSAMDLVQSERVRKIAVLLNYQGNEGPTGGDRKVSPDNYYRVDIEKVKRDIGKIVSDNTYTIKTWQQLNSYYDSVTGIYNTIFGFIGAVMAVVVILSIYNTMYMAVVERTREIGTLMAVGTPRKYVLLLFLLEALTIAVIGGILGYGGTYLASHVISNAGLSMPPPPGGTEGYPLIVHTVYLWWFYITLFIMFNTVMACLLPAFRASRMSIVKALYHV